MSDKPIAGLVAAAAVAPLCAIRILGPALSGSAVSSAARWFGGLDHVAATAMTAEMAAFVYGILRLNQVGRSSYPKAPLPIRLCTGPNGLKCGMDSTDPWMKVGAQVILQSRCLVGTKGRPT